MDIGLIIQLLSGVVGGNVAGSQLGEKSLGTLGNSLAGLVGGGLGGQILTALLGMGAASAGGGLDLGSIITQLAGGGVGGAVLTAIVGMLKQNFAK
jgi:hypothetical protein